MRHRSHLILITTISLNILATPVFADIHQAKAAIRVRDFGRALNLLKPLAETGDPAAEFHLGALYRCGCGLERDDKSAFAWFKKAAGKNFTRAQFSLGNMYENGWGTQADKEKAKFWFQKAASAGHRMARAKLGNTDLAPVKPGNALAKHNTNKKPMDPSTRFRWAARRGLSDELMDALNSGVDINSKDVNGRTALMDTSENGHHAIARLLIKRGAKVRLTDKFSDNALLLATRNQHKKLITVLSTAGSNINSRDLNGNTPLIVATEKGHKAIVSVLLKRGANVHLKNKRGHTALAIAQKKSKLKGQYRAIAKLLLAGGARVVKTKTAKAEVPLSVLEQLSPSTNNSKNVFKGWSPLMIATWRGQTQAVSTLLANPHESLDSIDDEGYTVLSRAVYQGHLDIVKIPLNAEAKTEVRTETDKLPIIIAVSRNHEAIVDELVNAGAKLNLSNASGQTPLMLAILKKQHKIIQKLLKASVSVDIRDKKGNTALIHTAKKWGRRTYWKNC